MAIQDLIQGAKGAFTPSSESLQSAGKGLMSAGVGAAADAVYNGLSGGKSSGLGNAVGAIGKIGKAIPGPIGMYIQGAGAVLGGGINALAGMSLNQEKINEINNQAAAANNFKSNASSFDEFMANAQTASRVNNFGMSDIGKAGPLAKGKLRKEYDKLKDRADQGNAYLDRSLENNAGNISLEQAGNLLADYKAFGGTLSTNGADFSNGYKYIGNGDTHEKNPYQGVQMGVDQQGIPNLVEEGEFIYKDYVFSNRIKVPSKLKQKYALKDRITFAEACKKMSKEAEERPNDPISKRGLEAILNDFMGEQEQIRQKIQERKLKKELSKLSPEEQNILQSQLMLSQEEQMPQFANGGNLFDEGGPQYGYFWKGTNQAGKSPILRGDYATIAKYPYFSPIENKNGNYDLIFDKDTNYTPGSEYMRRVSFLDNNWKNPLNFHNKVDYVNSVARVNKEMGNTPKVPLTIDTSVDKVLNAQTDGEIGAHHLIPSYNLASLAGTSYIKEKRFTDADMVNHDYYYDKNHDVLGLNMIRPDAKLAIPELPKGGLNDKNKKAVDKAIENLGETESAMPKFDNWLRYAPVVGAAISLGNNLINKPSYKNANELAAIAENAGNYREVAFNPIGDYLTYRPMDRLAAINQANAANNATMRNVMNTSGGNRAIAMAGVLAAGNNYQNQIGNLFRQAEEYNENQRKAVAEFNRGTNQFNSEGFFKADSANQAAAQNAAARKYDLLTKSYAMRDAIDERRQTNISADFTNLFDSLGGIGQENMNRDIISWMGDKGLLGNYGKKPVVASNKTKEKTKTSNKTKKGVSNG